jgi:hypothetical protein
MTDTFSNTETRADSTSRTRSGPRLFWVGMAAFLVLIVFLGFWPTYFGPLLSGEAPGHPEGLVETTAVIHVHGAVFVGWMALLLGQTVLAARGRMRAHMTLGSYGGLALGIAVVLAGSLIVYQQAAAAVAKAPVSWAERPRILLGAISQWSALLTFSILVGLGLLYRTRPAAHKRYVVWATVQLLAGPATNRMEYLLGSWSNAIGIAAMVAPLLAYDLYTEGRLHWATLVGAGLIGANYVLVYLLSLYL